MTGRRVGRYLVKRQTGAPTYMATGCHHSILHYFKRDRVFKNFPVHSRLGSDGGTHVAKLTATSCIATYDEGRGHRVRGR